MKTKHNGFFGVVAHGCEAGMVELIVVKSRSIERCNSTTRIEPSVADSVFIMDKPNDSSIGHGICRDFLCAACVGVNRLNFNVFRRLNILPEVDCFIRGHTHKVVMVKPRKHHRVNLLHERTEQRNANVLWVAVTQNSVSRNLCLELFASVSHKPDKRFNTGISPTNKRLKVCGQHYRSSGKRKPRSGVVLCQQMDNAACVVLVEQSADKVKLQQTGFCFFVAFAVVHAFGNVHLREPRKF